MGRSGESQKTNILNESAKISWNFWRPSEVVLKRTKPSMERAKIFSGKTQYMTN